MGKFAEALSVDLVKSIPYLGTLYAIAVGVVHPTNNSVRFAYVATATVTTTDTYLKLVSKRFIHSKQPKTV